MAAEGTHIVVDSAEAGGAAGGVLAGTYPNPTFAAGAIQNADVNAAAAIVASKLDLTSPGAIGTTAAAAGKFTTLQATGTTTLNLGLGVAHSSAGGVISSSTIVNADVDAAAAIVASKLDLTSPGGIGTTVAGLGTFTTLSATTALAIGATPATAGDIRLYNGGVVSSRNAANNGNLNILQLDGLNNVQIGSGSCAGIQFVNTNLFITSSLSAPTFSQADVTTGSATGATLTLHAQNATGATANGGQLDLASGTGTTAAGAVRLLAGAAEKLKINATGIGFFAVAPVSRASALTQTYATVTRTHANDTATDMATTASTNATPFGFATAAQADAIATKFNALRVDVDNLKQFVNSLVDDMQAYGLEQ